MTEQELRKIEQQMVDHYGTHSPEATDFAFRALAKVLAEVRRLRRLQDKSSQLNAA